MLSAWSAGAHPALVVEIARAQTPPQIDGDLGDWLMAQWLPVAPGAPYVAQGGWGQLRDDGVTEPAGTARTARDLSGSFSLLWDDEWLYLAAQVADNVHDVVGGEPWQWFCKDAVALFLDVPRDEDGPSWFVGDHAFVFVADPSQPNTWWRRGSIEGRQEGPAPPQTRLAVRLRPEGYALEAAIPLAVLTQHAPAFRLPLAGQTAGFMVLVADPDGGPQPFGGQLLYGGDSDDDASWSQLKFLAAGDPAPPKLEISAAELEFEAKLREDQRALLPVYLARQTSDAALEQQRRIAAEYFQIYLQHRPAKISARALSMAFTLWGNAKDTAEIRRALAQISYREDVWDQVVPGLRQAFYLDDRFAEGFALIEALEKKVVPLKSRSALLLVLATTWMGQGQVEKARQSFVQIIAWQASAWHVEQARHYLSEIDSRAPAPQ